ATYMPRESVLPARSAAAALIGPPVRLPRPCFCGAIHYQHRRISAMSQPTTSAPPVVVDVPVPLTAIVRAEPDAGGYSASIPALPGCHTQGETLDEVRANLREAGEGWLAVAHDDGLAREASGTAP